LKKLADTLPLPEEQKQQAIKDASAILNATPQVSDETMEWVMNLTKIDEETMKKFGLNNQNPLEQFKDVTRQSSDLLGKIFNHIDLEEEDIDSLD